MTEEIKNTEQEVKEETPVRATDTAEIPAADIKPEEDNRPPLECSEPKEEVKEEVKDNATRIVLGNTEVLTVQLLAEIRDILLRLEKK